MINFLMVDDIIKFALKEDIGSGDITVNAVDSFLKGGVFTFMAKEPFILCGTDVARRVFHILDPYIKVDFSKKDGDLLKNGEKFGQVSGDCRYILMGERVCLNFLQRMSAISTETNKYAQKLMNTKTTLLDTRKTTPGHRVLEKYAVKIGGGSNHRFGLFDGVMLKDNHIDAVGGIKKAVEIARHYAPSTVKIEVETRNLKEVKEAVAVDADIVMLDNFRLEDIPKAREIAGMNIKLEISGGVTLENIEKYVSFGVDYISVGAITHKIKNVDISLKYQRENQ